jgi:hypothetical protein
MYEEYREFVEKRLMHFENGDADTPNQTHYTVMIENLPKELRSSSSIADFINEIFPGS